MNIVFGIGMVITNICAAIKKRSKVLFWLQILFIWILLGWNAGGMDFGENQIIYEGSGKVLFRGLKSYWLSDMVAYVFHRFELDFIAYNIFTTGAALMLMAKTILQNTKNANIVLILFLINPFCDSLIQKRFFLGMILVFCGIEYLKENKTVKYLIFVILAVGMHFSFVLFIPLCLIKKLTPRKENIIIAVSIVIEIVLINYGKQILSIIFPISKLELYFTGKRYSSFLIGIIYSVTLLGYIVLFYRLFKKYRMMDIQLFDFVWKLNKFAILLSPLCLLESVYMRYFRIILLWDYIAISNLNRGLKKSFWVLFFVWYLFTVSIVIIITGEFGMKGVIDTIVNNLILGGKR